MSVPPDGKPVKTGVDDNEISTHKPTDAIESEEEKVSVREGGREGSTYVLASACLVLAR